MLPSLECTYRYVLLELLPASIALFQPAWRPTDGGYKHLLRERDVHSILAKEEGLSGLILSRTHAAFYNSRPTSVLLSFPPFPASQPKSPIPGCVGIAALRSFVRSFVRLQPASRGNVRRAKRRLQQLLLSLVVRSVGQTRALECQRATERRASRIESGGGRETDGKRKPEGFDLPSAPS